jgi:hypothetical protein
VLKAQNAKSAFIEGNDATSVTLFSLMNVRIRVKAFDEHGIKLIPPTDADFNGLARPLIGRVADIGLKLKPMLVIVSNESPHTVVSYSKTWTARYAGGRTSVIRSHASFPETVCGDILIAKDPEALPPGGKRVETASVVIQAYAQSEPYYDQFLDQFIVEKDRMLASAEELEIELGAVTFADNVFQNSQQVSFASRGASCAEQCADSGSCCDVESAPTEMTLRSV